MGVWSRKQLACGMLPIASVFMSGCDLPPCPDGTSSDGERCISHEADAVPDLGAPGDANGVAVAGSGAKLDSVVMAGSVAALDLTSVAAVGAAANDVADGSLNASAATSVRSPHAAAASAGTADVARCIDNRDRGCAFNVAADGAEDTSTGLVWQRSLSSTHTWNEATTYCAERGRGWRLPTHEELYALKDAKSATDPAVFPDIPQGFFWTSSMSTRTLAGVDNLFAKIWGTSEKTAHHYVRCVR